MSGAQIGGVIGGIIGFVWGGGNWQAGYAIGSAIGGALDPPKIKGPSIGDAQNQTSMAGVGRPWVIGHPAPFKGNLIDGEKKARKVIKKKSQGKGGGPVIKEEHFLLTYAIRISAGPVILLRAWRNGVCVIDNRRDEDMPGYPAASVTRYAANVRAKQAKFMQKCHVYLGGEDQMPDPWLEALHGVGNTPYYRGTALIVLKDDDVTDTGGAVPMWMFECAEAGELVGTYNLDPGGTRLWPLIAIPGAPDWQTNPFGDTVHATGVPAYDVAEITLAEVVERIARRCGIPESKFDFDALAPDEGNTTLPGLLVAEQHTGGAVMSVLENAFFFDHFDVDGQVKGAFRGGPVALSIPADVELDLGDDEQVTRSQTLEFPAKVTVVTQEPEAEYAPIPQTSVRSSPDVTVDGELMVRIPIPFGADRAKQIAEQIHQVVWTQAEARMTRVLPEEYSVLVKGDAVTYDFRRWLIDHTNFADGVMTIEAKRDRASDYTSNGIGFTPDPPDPPNNGGDTVTLLEFMNLPMLADAHDRIGFYVAVSGISDSWLGCVVQGSIDGGATRTDLAVVTPSGACVIGMLVTALPEAAAEVVDRVNTVRVQVVGELESISAAQLYGEQNACLIGDELCQFKTATLVDSDGAVNTYDLSELTRGRLDTAPAAHAIDDRFVLLNAPIFCEVPGNWIGQTITLRAPTAGTLDDDNPDQTHVWTPAEIQREWAPTGFVGTRDGSNNCAVRWNGRARLGSTAAPFHSANFLGWRVTFTKAGNSIAYDTTAPALYYSATQQTLDFGSATGTLGVAVRALNRITGVSDALTGSIP